MCDTTGTRVINSCTLAVVDDCVVNHGTGWSCQAGACIPPVVEFVPFNALRDAQSFTATGHLQALPALLTQGDSSHVYWNVTNAASCTVSGTNGDSWSGLFSGTSGKTTSPIQGETTYTLHCVAIPNATPPTLDESATVSVRPSFQEI